jgi:cyclopropane fatty-acyl-phospholipid synthase-like methyltransferase
MSEYTREYYEEGVAKGISGYTNYSWQPELTIPLAHRLMRRLEITERDSVLDYGCAKGFLVKALRLLDVSAYGCDISEYAISQVDPNYRRFCQVGTYPHIATDWIIAKDVLEHLTKEQVRSFAREALMADNLFIVVPLGNGEKYNVPQYEQDVTHVIREPIGWWCDTLSSAGWYIKEASTNMKGLKDSWAQYKDGNAAIECSR